MSALVTAEALVTVADLGIATRGDAVVQLVRGVSFAVAEGERLGVVGESGSGKTITALAITGLLPGAMTVTGSIDLAGTQVVGAPEGRLRPVRGRDVAMVFQEPLTALDPLMRVGRQVAEPLRRHRHLRGAALDGAVRAALEEVALPSDERILRAFPHELSGGQRQRIALAMALACNPRLLIADEPTTALDVTVQAEILDLVARVVAERRMALLFVTHDIGVIVRVATRLIVMRGGEIVEEGPADEVIRHPRHPYTRTLVDGARLLDRALDRGHLGGGGISS